MKRWLVAVALLAMPGAVVAQGRGMGAMMQSPLRVVLDKKAELGLSAEQVAKIEAMEAELAKTNEAPMAEVRKIREANPDMRNMPEAERDKMREQMRTIQTNNTAAREKLKDVLTPEQLAAANEAIEAAMPRRGRRGGG